MKRPEYVAGVTLEYRKALDGKTDKSAVFRLKELFNRGGFTHGYLYGNRDVTYPLKADHLGVKIGKVKKVIAKGKAFILSLIHIFSRHKAQYIYDCCRCKQVQAIHEKLWRVLQ